MSAMHANKSGPGALIWMGDRWEGGGGGVEYIGQDDERGDESVCVYVYYMCVTDQDRKTSNGQIDFRQSKTRQKDKVMWEQDSIDRKNRSV